jgi:hypothetical protein
MAKDERPYARIDLGLPNNRKLRDLTVHGKWLYVSTLLWCGLEMNDGVFRPKQAVAYADVATRYVKELTDAGVWHEKGHHCDTCPQPEAAGDLVVHDYIRHNRTAERIRKISADRKLAGRRANHTRWKHEGEFEDCEACND